MTNIFQTGALLVAGLYKKRWQIELFFKWIKQHLKIKEFWGQSENAVKTQIWIAVCAYLLVAVTKKQVKTELGLYEILQILSISAFDQTPLNQLLMSSDLQNINQPLHNQLKMFEL